MGKIAAPLVDELRRHFAHRQPEKVLDLRGKNNHGNAGREAGGHGIGDELDQSPQPEHAHEDHDCPGHDRGGGQAGVAVMGGNVADDHNEGARRPADLHAAAAQRGNQESGHNGRIKAHCRWRNAFALHDTVGNRTNSECHRQRQRDHPHGDAGNDIGEQCPPGISFTQADDRLGQESRHGLARALFGLKATAIRLIRKP